MKDIEPWIQLSAAIVNSGVHESDKLFLESDWCRYLTNVVMMFRHEQSEKSMPVKINKGGQVHNGKDL